MNELGLPFDTHTTYSPVRVIDSTFKPKRALIRETFSVEIDGLYRRTFIPLINSASVVPHSLLVESSLSDLFSFGMSVIYEKSSGIIPFRRIGRKVEFLLLHSAMV